MHLCFFTYKCAKCAHTNVSWLKLKTVHTTNLCFWQLLQSEQHQHSQTQTSRASFLKITTQWETFWLCWMFKFWSARQNEPLFSSSATRSIRLLMKTKAAAQGHQFGNASSYRSQEKATRWAHMPTPVWIYEWYVCVIPVLSHPLILFSLASFCCSCQCNLQSLQH